LRHVVVDTIYKSTTITGRDARIKPAELQMVFTIGMVQTLKRNFKLSNPHKLFLTNNFKGGAIASVFGIFIGSAEGSNRFHCSIVNNDNHYPFPEAKETCMSDK
jgi:hypothetical protein